MLVVCPLLGSLVLDEAIEFVHDALAAVALILHVADAQLATTGRHLSRWHIIPLHPSL